MIRLLLFAYGRHAGGAATLGFSWVWPQWDAVQLATVRTFQWNVLIFLWREIALKPRLKVWMLFKLRKTASQRGFAVEAKLPDVFRMGIVKPAKAMRSGGGGKPPQPIVVNESTAGTNLVEKRCYRACATNDTFRRYILIMSEPNAENVGVYKLCGGNHVGYMHARTTVNSPWIARPKARGRKIPFNCAADLVLQGDKCQHATARYTQRNRYFWVMTGNQWFVFEYKLVRHGAVNKEQRWEVENEDFKARSGKWPSRNASRVKVSHLFKDSRCSWLEW